MNIKLEFSIEQLNVILNGLGDLPPKEVHQLMNTIVQTAALQLNPPPAAPEAPVVEAADVHQAQ